MQTVNKLLGKLKIKAFELRKNYQLPKCLVNQIYKLGVDTPKDVVEYYMLLSQHFMRIVDYYRKFPEYEKVAEEEITKDLKQKGYY